MSVSAAFVSATLICAFVPICEASAFLRPHVSAEPEHVTRDRVLQGLLSELSGDDDSAKIQEFEEELRTMYIALPKGFHGALEPSTVHYALHRYFAQKHGWHMKGLELKEPGLNATSPVITELFGQSLKSHGTDLGRLALIASKLTHLVKMEASKNLENVYSALRLSTTSHVRKKDAESALKWYLVMYLLGDSTEGIQREDLVSGERDVTDMYPAWRSVKMWSKDLAQSFQFTQRFRRNPFVLSDDVAFDHSNAVVQEFGRHFGSFQKTECQSLKAALVEMELDGTGRVPLSEFYRTGLRDDWQFNENAEYLRSLGALDESDPRRPSVFIPNYLHSQTNCLSTSGFYSVCCPNECEGLLAHLERRIAAPGAPPARVAEIVSWLESDTVEAPRNLSHVQLARLSAIANVNGGEVPLHGRLFAQWMHHAYPRECPFPHLSGSLGGLSQEEWLKSMGGESPLATKEEMQRRATDLEAMMVGTEMQALPWIELDELIDTPQEVPCTSWLLAFVRFAAILAVLASSALPLARSGKGASERKLERCLV